MGPWFVREKRCPQTNLEDPSVVTESGGFVAGHLNSFAEARLIAAAPDLLAACEPIAKEIFESAGDVFHDTWNPDAHVELTLTIAECRAALTAIAKAKGTS